LDESRKREYEVLVALAAEVSGVRANGVPTKRRRSKKKKGTTLGDSEKAKALRREMVELVRANAHKGKEACENEVVEAGFDKKEVQMYILHAAASVDGIEFEQVDSEERSKNSKSSSDE
jgi:hypothetical protein